MDPTSQRFLFTSNSAGTGYWVATFSDFSSIVYSLIAPSGHTYCLGTNSSNTAILVFKLNEFGQVAWARQYNGDITGFDFAECLTIDLSENLYIGARVSNSGFSQHSSNRSAVIKYSSSGTLLLNFVLNYDGFFDAPNGVVVDDSGNIYTAGTIFDGGLYYGYTAKFSAGGVLAWSSVYESGSVYYGSIVTDQLSNVYVGGAILSAGSDAAVLIKYNSSGTVQWQRGFQTPSGIHAIATDRAFAGANPVNIYATGFIKPAGQLSRIFVVKYDNSGNVQWRRAPRNLNDYVDEFGAAIAVSSDNFIYVAGADEAGVIVIKYDSNGNMIWSRKLVPQATTFPITVFSISVANPASICLSCVFGLGDKFPKTYKLRADGNQIGLFEDVQYLAGDVIDVVNTEPSVTLSGQFPVPANPPINTVTSYTDQASSSTNTISILP